MKVKRLREDFVVHEVCDLPVRGGTYAVYRLQKVGLGTPEAVTEVLNIWNLPRENVQYAGLKDRHATTSQTVTIQHGPRDSIVQSGFSLTYVGQSHRSVTAADIVGNQFDLTLRSLPESQAMNFAQQLLGTSAQTLCVPNYFDDQRFGSLGESGQFIAPHWCLANYEQALFLAIAEAGPHDRPNDSEQKAILREHWGQWQECKDRLERSHRRSIVTYLCDHPTGFKKAVGLIRKDLRGIYVAAFQAKLWNEVVVRRLRQLLPNQTEFITAYGAGGKLLFPQAVGAVEVERLSTVNIPLPSGRKTEWAVEDAAALDQALEEFDMPRHKLRFSYPRDVFFSRGLRPLLLVPQNVQCAITADELSTGHEKKLTLSFQLRAGQYATMLLKTLEMLSAT
ncbi:MAG: tRNA pseudouridine(13) synthase TruD [Pirellulaceae bacterium]